VKAQLAFPQIKQLNIHCEVIENLKEFANKADTISCATLSTEPLIWGEWLQKGYI
jgi:ornithine cyclodeaminase